MEEGLKCRGLAAVVGEATRLSLTASRRLQLAAGEMRRDRRHYSSLAQRDGEGPGERAQCGCDALAYFTASVAAEELRWVGPATLAR